MNTEVKENEVTNEKLNQNTEYPFQATEIPLTKTYEFRNEKINKLIMRESTARDRIYFENLKGTTTEKDMMLFSLLTGVDAEFFQNLREYDYDKVVEAYGDFFLHPSERVK